MVLEPSALGATLAGTVPLSNKTSISVRIVASMLACHARPRETGVQFSDREDEVTTAGPRESSAASLFHPGPAGRLVNLGPSGTSASAGVVPAYRRSCPRLPAILHTTSVLQRRWVFVSSEGNVTLNYSLSERQWLEAPRAGVAVPAAGAEEGRPFKLPGFSPPLKPETICCRVLQAVLVRTCPVGWVR